MQEGEAELGGDGRSNSKETPRIKKGIIKWFHAPKTELEHLVFPKIVPGENDFKVDRVKDETTHSLVQINRSRGKRGGKIIAAAARHMLDDVEMGRVRVLDMGNEIYSKANFQSPLILPKELEFFERRKNDDMVLALAQEIVRAAPE
jgi:hypothetical protein